MMSRAARVIAVVLRLLTAAAAGAAAVVMATSSQQQEADNNFVFDLPLEASFQDAASFVFFVVANAVACAYSMLAIIVPPASPAARFVLVTDVIVAMILTGALGAAGAVSELGKNGNSRAFWQPVCGLLHTFCVRVGGALISALVALVLSFFTLMYSIYTVTKPPSPPSSEP